MTILRNLRRIHIAPQALPDPRPTGTISGEEYQRMAAELAARKRQLVADNAAFRVLCGRTTRPECNITHNDVAVAAESLATLAEGKQIVLSPGKGPCTQDKLDDADIVIKDVHKLPQRQKFRPLPDDMRISCSSAMLIQQETGKYPTLEDHLNKTSPAYRVTEGQFGQMIYEPIEEHNQMDDCPLDMLRQCRLFR